MANLPINDPKTFSTDMTQLELTSLVHKDTMNPMFKQLLDNDAYLNEKKLQKGCTWGDMKGV